MRLHDNPELLDRLAAAYALGTLRGGARRRFEAIARQSPAVRVAALSWQERFAALTELQPAEQPSANVWKRIENLLEAEAAPPRSTVPMVEASMFDRMRTRLGWWRGGAVAAGVAALAVGAVSWQLSQGLQEREQQLAQAAARAGQLTQQNARLAAELQAKPEIRYVAVLSDEKSNASMLVTFDPAHNTLTLKRVAGIDEGQDKSLELWALPPGGAPRSLGVLGQEPVVRLTASPQEVQEVPALAISLEPKGGAPAGSGPTGPVLFKGPLLQTPT